MKSIITKIQENIDTTIGWNNIPVSKKNKNIVLYSIIKPENDEDEYEVLAFKLLKEIGADPIIAALKKYYKDKIDRLSRLYEDIIFADLDLELTTKQENFIYTPSVIKLIDIIFTQGSADRVLSYYLEEIDNNKELDEFKMMIKK